MPATESTTFKIPYFRKQRTNLGNIVAHTARRIAVNDRRVLKVGILLEKGAQRLHIDRDCGSLW